MEKRVLLKNILSELNQLPEAYLLHWYELIHTFREKLSVKEDVPKQSQKDDFDWDGLVEEVMKNRHEGNQQRMSRIESLLSDQ